jgi:pimeloyl-ACP methyl ester carboxylesterase
MRFEIDGCELAYAVSGDGPPLLLLHAFPLALFMWDPQAEALAATHRVIRFDARGFGASDPAAGPLTMERIADDGAALLDHLGVRQAVVGGCSMGGYAAFAFVRRHPGQVRALYLQDTRAGADTADAKANRVRLAGRVSSEGASVAVEAFLPKLTGETTQRDNAPLVAHLRERILATPSQAIADALHGLAARADSRRPSRASRRSCWWAPGTCWHRRRSPRRSQPRSPGPGSRWCRGRATSRTSSSPGR